MNSKFVLVADGSLGANIAMKAFEGGDFQIATAHTLEHAEKMLMFSDHKFDVVIAGLHFDDSRMIDLLQYIRQTDGLEELAFLPIQTKMVSSAHMSSLNEMLSILGSHPILVLHGQPFPKSCVTLRRAVQSSLGETVKRRRKDKTNQTKPKENF